MKRSTTLAFFIAIASFAHAQPVLTFTGNAPAPGSTRTLHYGPYVSPGGSGANQNWDLSALTTDSTILIQHVQPGTTPNGASFPGSTVAETGAAATMFFRSASDGVYRFAAWRSGGYLALKFNRRTALEPTTKLSYEALHPPLRQTAVTGWRSCRPWLKPLSLLSFATVCLIVFVSGCVLALLKFLEGKGIFNFFFSAWDRHTLWQSWACVSACGACQRVCL
ncbi:MAG: hypothetical protein U0V45_03085 [Flavobacteriales bacterium]